MSAVLEILAFTFGVTLLYSIISRLLVKPGDVRALKKEIEQHKESMNQAKKENSTEKTNQAMSEMLKANQKLLRKNMKPLLASLVIFFIALSWLAGAYAGSVIILPFSLPFFGQDIGWFWWYLVITIPFTTLFRKLLGVE